MTIRVTDTPVEYQPFYWRSYTIFHGEGVLKIGTDAILLGTWIGKVVDHPTHIVDAGCGSGILSIMASAHFQNAVITAIDNHPEAIALTQRNAIQNALDHRLVAMQLDMLEEQGKEEPANLVISNPPFYYNQLPAVKPGNVQSKHSGATPTLWMQGLAKRLTLDGKLALVLPFDLTGKWIAAANSLGLYVDVRLNVFSFERDEHPIRSLMLLSRQLKKPSLDKLILYHADQQYTEQYIQWIK
jgi:tRNA1(Val) A37 N6-methylase TrmN6